MSRDFDGYVIVVTGGSTGLGRAIAVEVAKGGAKFAQDHADMDAVSAEDFLRLYHVNVVGAYQMIRAARTLLAVIRQDVVVEHFTELLIADGAKRTIVRVAGSITDQDIDGAEAGIGLGDQVAQCLFGRDARGNRDRPTVSVSARYLIDHGLTSFLLARCDDYSRTLFGHPQRDRTADAPRRARNDGYLVGQIK